MTLLFMDGFDHYATADITKKWTANNGSAISSNGGRRGGGCLSHTGTGKWVTKTIASSSTVIVGCAVKITTYTAGYLGKFQLREGATYHLTLNVNTNGKISLLRGGSSTGTVLATGNTALSTGTWYYIELKSTIHDTTGSYEVRINGVTEFSGTGADTRNGGTSGIVDTVGLGQASNSGEDSYDDFYVCDTSGSTNNDFLGDCRIDTLFPNGDGNYTAFTPSTGSTHYTLVDETAPNTTDYNSGASSGDRDSYAFQDLTTLSSQTIYGIQINAAALKSDAGARSLGTMSRLSGTNKDGTGAALSTSQTYISEIQETDPASAAWTQTNVDSAEYGVKVTA